MNSSIEYKIDLSETKKRLNTVGNKALLYLAMDTRTAMKRLMKKGDTRRKGQVIKKKSAAAGEPPLYHDHDDKPHLNRLLQKLIIYEKDTDGTYYVGSKMVKNLGKSDSSRPAPNVLEFGGKVVHTNLKNVSKPKKRPGSRPDTVKDRKSVV
jgi:hypothetical protein